MGKDIDAISRDRIISEMNKNFFVEAGAGSGKTTMLVNRMVAMVESGIDISKICAITFTKAAAGEFYNRFQKLLSQRANPDFQYEDKAYAGQLPKPTDETRAYCEAALKDIDLCFMGTIDAFCNVVLSEHPSDAKIPSDATIISDEEMETILNQEYVRLFNGEYGDEMQQYAIGFAQVHRDPRDTFVTIMKQFVDRRNIHFNYVETSPINVDEKYKSQADSVRQLIRICTNHPEVVNDGPACSQKAMAALQRNAKTLFRKWSYDLGGVIQALNALCGLRIYGSAIDKHPFDLSILTAMSGQKYKPIWEEKNDDSFVAQLNNLQFNLSMTFCMKSLPIIEKILHDAGRLTFFDYLYYLRNMLKEDAKKDGKLIHYIFKRHSFFLIDEFQDTNPLQAEVFFYLTAEHPVEKWMECDPKPGSLFIVGDPKQSIYRFRNADVASYLRVRTLFEKGVGDVLQLTRNFRSNKELCGYYNEIFSKLLTGETKTQSKFEKIPLPDETKGQVLEGKYFYECVTSSARESYPTETDEAFAVKIIQRLVDNPKYMILPAGSSEPRMIQYKDFMIIPKSKALLPTYIEFFKKANIPIRVEGSVPFTSNEALSLIRSLYAVMADPSDVFALNRALKMKLFRFTDGALVEYQSTGRRVVIDRNRCEDDLKPIPEHLLEVDKSLALLSEMAHRAKNLSPAAVFQDVIDALEIFKFVTEEDMEVLCYALELLRAKERDGSIVTLKDGVDYIGTLVDGETEEERCLRLQTDENCVHIANLHKVKGLEAPIVIIPYAGTNNRGPDMFVEYGEESTEGYVFKVRPKFGDGNYDIIRTSDNDDYKDEAKQGEKDENDRLVYVAATRARSVLIVGKAMQERKSNPPFWKCLDSDLKPIMELLKDEQVVPLQQGKVLDPDSLYEKAKSECVLNDRKAENPTYEVQNPSRTRMKTKMDDDSDEETIATGPDKSVEDDQRPEGVASEESKTAESEWRDHLVPALIGSMTHRLMEMIVSSRNAIDKKNAVDEITREYRSPKNEKYEQEIRTALLKVVEVLDAGGYVQSNGAPQDVVKTLCEAEEVYCEVPFCYKEEPTIWNGVIDVIYKENGKWHILDYKTNADGSDLDNKYLGQLQAYIKAFKLMTGEDADAKTYHIDV